MYYGPWMNDPKYDELRTRLAALKVKHDTTASGDYAKQQRTFARRLCIDMGLDSDDAVIMAPWAALRPTGWQGRVAEFDRAHAAEQELKQQEEAHQKAMKDFHEEELGFQTMVESGVYQWKEEHGAAFFEYLDTHPCFETLALWDGLRRLALAWSTAEPVNKYHDTHPLPCPLPPACGRGAFLASLPPGTPDLGKTYPGPGYIPGYQVLQDDLII